MWLLVAFIAVPLIEIALFIQVGGAIGLWPTLGLVLASAIAGSALLRHQGAQTLAELRGALSDLRDPTGPIANGALIFLAGALLLTPGFFSDILGILLLLPPVRHAVISHVASRFRVEGFSMGAEPPRQQGRDPRRHAPDIIDADYHEITSDHPPVQGPSGWTRH